MKVKTEQSTDPSTMRPHAVVIPIRGRSISENRQTNSPFAPHPEPRNATPTERRNVATAGDLFLPEKRLTFFAFHLAVLEKSASGLGALAFIWATVVLLGGFAGELKRTDFAFVTVILATEGARIFSRSHELEWQQQPTRNSQVGWVFASKAISRILSWLQLLSAAACAALSLLRLSQQDYGQQVQANRNAGTALNLFYGLALAEALVFLVEKVYWALRIHVCDLLGSVSAESELGPSGIVPLRRFFYEAYSKCINDSVFDGLRLDLVSFAKDLLDSLFHSEQLMGVRVLHKLAHSDRFAGGALRKIGTSSSAMERLVEMLNWKNPGEEEIRRCAADIVAKLAGRKRNALRVAAIPGAMESLSSLLDAARDVNYDSSEFNLLGLVILKKLAADHANRWKIGTTRGLVPKIIDLTGAVKTMATDQSQIATLKRALQVVKMLVSADGGTGQMIQQEVAENVFTVSNLRQILEKNGDVLIKKLAIEILKCLSMDSSAKEKIGGTGGVIRLLAAVFFKTASNEDENSACEEAGETLAILALDSERNCGRILMEPEMLGRLTNALTNPVRRLNASRILRNLCAYSSSEFSDRLRGITAAMPTVLMALIEGKEKLVEISAGLTTQICKFMDSEGFGEAMKQARIEEAALVGRLAHVLEAYTYPDVKVPGIRRYVIEQAIWMMRSSRSSVQLFRKLEMKRLLESAAETTSELECFQIFSGNVGVSRHSKTLLSLVETALFLLPDDLLPDESE